MENSYRFFENRECKYFPCHKEPEEFNCLFCYCPLYFMEECPGDAKYIEKDGRCIRDCSDCTFPHCAENYDVVIELLREQE